MTSSDFVSASQNLWNFHLSHGDAPIFFSSDFEKPVGFATFLACSTHLRKLFVPGTFNVSKMVKSVPRQGSELVVCDSDLYNLEAPSKKQQEY